MTMNKRIEIKCVTTILSGVSIAFLALLTQTKILKEIVEAFTVVAQSYPTLCDLWTAAHQVSMSLTNSWSLFKLMSIESMMPFNHLILCHPLFLLPSSFPASGSYLHIEASVQSSSVTQSYPTLCNPMNCSTAGLPVHHQLLEFTQTHVHQVSDAIQPCHPLSSSSPPAPSSSQHQGLFQ